MNLNISSEKNIHGWSLKLWLWVLLCAAGIFSTVPVARSIQRFVYDTVGKEFFTYTVLFAVGAGLAILLYFFIFKLKVKRASKYIWLFICAGLYVYFTIQMRKQPEEAIHFLEYGLLSYFLFKALSHRIHDRTIYLTTVLFALFVGIADEFLQWIMPQRFWDFRDVGFNILAGCIFILAVWKGIRPEIISKQVKKISVSVLAGIIILDLIILGLCLSNTPDSVRRYTAIFDSLSWLRSEEPMTEFGYKHKDPEIGTFYSRLTLEELREIDYANGDYYGGKLTGDIDAEPIYIYQELMKTYTPYNNPFLYEFLTHILRRDNKFEELAETNNPDRKIEISNIAYREHLLIEKYFKNTLRHSESGWSDEKIKGLQKTASSWKEDYTSEAGGKIITSFSLKTAWSFILVTLVAVWTLGEFWKRRLNI